MYHTVKRYFTARVKKIEWKYGNAPDLIYSRSSMLTHSNIVFKWHYFMSLIKFIPKWFTAKNIYQFHNIVQSLVLNNSMSNIPTNTLITKQFHILLKSKTPQTDQLKLLFFICTNINWPLRHFHFSSQGHGHSHALLSPNQIGTRWGCSGMTGSRHQITPI